MSFSLSTVLDSFHPYQRVNTGAQPEHADAGLDYQSYQKARNAIKHFAPMLFKGDLMTRNGYQMLVKFRECNVSVEDLTKTDTKDQINLVASLCHSRVLKAKDEGRDLNPAEIEEVKAAFANLAKLHEQGSVNEEELTLDDRHITQLSTASDLLIKVSNEFVKHLDNFQFSLASVLDELKLGGKRNSTVALKELGPKLFPEELCTHAGIRELKAVKQAPNFKAVTYDNCFTEAAKFVNAIAMKASEEKREVSEEEKNLIGKMFCELGTKFNALRTTKRLHEARSEKTRKYQEKLEKLQKFPAERDAKIKEHNTTITELKNQLISIANDTAKLVDQYQANSGGTEKGIFAEKSEEMDKAITALSEYKTSMEEKFEQLKNVVSKYKKEKLEADKKWNAHVEQNFASDQIVEVGIYPEIELSKHISWCKNNPGAVAECAMAYVDYLNGKVARKPAEASLWNLYGYWS